MQLILVLILLLVAAAAQQDIHHHIFSDVITTMEVTCVVAQHVWHQELLETDLLWWNTKMATINKRYKIDEILGVKDTYSASPGGPDFKNLGQVVFALRLDGGATCIGQCTTGNNLNPWGLCCYFAANVNSACAQNGCCTACGFSLGGSTAVYVALGSISGCGATLWRRIS